MVVQADGGEVCYQRLKRLLKDANYDEALAVVTRWDLRSIIRAAPEGLERLRFRCMISDVLDYGGLYPAAESILKDESGEHIGIAADQQLRINLRESYVRDEAVAKQQCWVLILWGMNHFRRCKFSDAMVRFELARQVAAYLFERAKNVRSIGTLARAWYCIGLVYREERRPGEARKAFRTALELAGKGITMRTERNESTASFDFNMARCAGLGMGWVAYNEANLTEAASALALARRMLIPAKARLIGAYLDTVQARLMMSEAKEPKRIEEALQILETAHSTLAPPNSLGHTHYALLCQNAIALAHLRLARACKPGEEEQRLRHLNKALENATMVKAAAKSPETERQNYCTALITESRIELDRGNPSNALALANEAMDKGLGIEPIRIDACIGVGEAYVAAGAYGKAISFFLEALERGQHNRKDSAACHLHLCHAYLMDHQPAKAREHFTVWESAKAGIENAFISDLAEKVRKMLYHKFRAFRITRSEVERRGDNKYHLNKLRRWLAETALDLDHDDRARAAHRLGIEPRTLAEWLIVEE